MRRIRSFRSAAVAGAWLLVVSGCGGAKITRTDPARGAYSPADLARFRVETAGPPPAFVQPEYVIGPGDVLDVVFLFHSDLSTRSLVVRPDGMISLPYLGDVEAAGRTPMQLDSLLTRSFGEILRSPEISVIVKETAAQQVYVLGEVHAPGVFPIQGPTSLVQAIARAGGMLRSASREHVVVLRRVAPDRVVGVEVNAADILEGRRMSDDLLLRNYDIVYVPKRPLYSAADFMETINQVMRPVRETVFTGWQILNLTASFEYFRSNANNSSNGSSNNSTQP